MTVKTKRATVYLEPELHRALKIKAAESSKSVSALINQAVRDSIIENLEDNEAFAERVNEELISYDALISKLKKGGRL